MLQLLLTAVLWICPNVTQSAAMRYYIASRIKHQMCTAIQVVSVVELSNEKQ